MAGSADKAKLMLIDTAAVLYVMDLTSAHQQAHIDAVGKQLASR